MLPPELALTGLTCEGLVYLYVTESTRATSYSDALKLFFVGEGQSPSPS